MLCDEISILFLLFYIEKFMQNKSLFWKTWKWMHQNIAPIQIECSIIKSVFL